MTSESDVVYRAIHPANQPANQTDRKQVQYSEIEQSI